jgi:hypothetical protein
MGDSKLHVMRARRLAPGMANDVSIMSTADEYCSCRVGHAI